jgi:hypothetical protein
MKAVEDTTLTQKLDLLSKEATVSPYHFNKDWIINKGWIVIPVEKGRHLEEGEARNLAQAIQSKGQKYCYAAATEDLGQAHRFHIITASEAGLLEFSDTCAGLNFSLTGEDLSFMIIFTSEDYNLYAGSQEFLEQALGCDISTALKAFQETASDDWWEGRLMKVYMRYWSS